MILYKDHSPSASPMSRVQTVLQVAPGKTLNYERSSPRSSSSRNTGALRELWVILPDATMKENIK